MPSKNLGKKPKERRKKVPRQESEPEPEGGPYERERQFLEERLSTIASKGSFRPPATRRLEEPGQPPEGPPPPSDIRHRIIWEYRKRQQLAKSSAPSQQETDKEDPELPLAPRPPPANNWIPIGPSVLRQGQGVASPEKSFSLALSGSGGPGRTVSQPKNSGAKARLLMNIRFNLKTAHTTQVKPVISADVRNPNQRSVAAGAA